MSKKAKDIPTKEQLKDLAKNLRSTKPEILIDSIKKVNIDFIMMDNAVPTLLNNLRANNKIDIIKLVILKFAELLSLHPEPLSLALSVMKEGEKTTTKWDGCERFAAFLKDDDLNVQAAAVKCIRFVTQAVYNMEADETRVKYTDNIFVISDPVFALTTHLGHTNPEVRINSLMTLYYLTPTKEITTNEQLLAYTPKVFEIMYSNPDSANFLSHFYPNPEEVQEDNRITLYLLDGMCQYKESHPLIEKVFNIYVAAIRRARITFIETIPLLPIPTTTDGEMENAESKLDESKTEEKHDIPISPQVLQFNVLLTWSYWAVNTTCSVLCTTMPNENEDEQLRNTVLRLLRELTRLIEHIDSIHCKELLHRVLDGLIELFKPRKWIRAIATQVRMLKVLLRKLSDPDQLVRDKIEIFLTLLSKYETVASPVATPVEMAENTEDQTNPTQQDSKEDISETTQEGELYEKTENLPQDCEPALATPVMEIQNILKGEPPCLQVNLLRSLLENPASDLDMKCRLCRFIYLIIPNEDNYHVILSANLIPVLVQVLEPFYPISEQSQETLTAEIESKNDLVVATEESKESDTSNPEESKDDNTMNIDTVPSLEKSVSNEVEIFDVMSPHLEPLSPLHYNLYVSIIKILNFLITHSAYGHHHFRNGLLSLFNVEDYVETDWESDTEIDSLIVVQGKSKAKPKAKKDKAKKEKPKGKGAVVVGNTYTTTYPLIDIIIQWMKNIMPEWKYEIQTTSSTDLIEHCPLFTLSMDFVLNLAKYGMIYKDIPPETPPIDPTNKKQSAIDTSIPIDPYSVTASRTLLKHINYFTSVPLYSINDDNEKGILYSIEVLKELLLLPDGLLNIMMNVNPDMLKLPPIENKPELIYPKKYTEEEKNAIDTEYKKQCEALNDDYAHKLIELTATQGDGMFPFLSVILRIFRLPCHKSDYIEEALHLFQTLCVSNDTENALLLYMKDNLAYKILDQGFLTYLISILDTRPLHYSEIELTTEIIEEIKQTAIYLITRGVHKTELKANPPETLKPREPEPEINPKKKKPTSLKNPEPPPPSKPVLPAGIFGPMEDDWTIVLNKLKKYEVYNIPESTPLHCAVNLGNTELVELLIKCHGNVSISDITGVSPLMTALSLGYDNIVDILITQGHADVNSVTVSGDPLIKFSIVSPDNDSVEQLQHRHFLKQPILPITGNSRMVLTLLKAGADPNVADTDGLFPLHMLIKGVTLTTRLKWISQGVINTEGKESNDPPSLLESTVNELIQSGAGVNRVDKYGCSALHYAISLGHVGVIKLLLSKGADVNIQDTDNFLPLHCLSLGRVVGYTGNENDIVEIAKILIEKGESRGIFTADYDNSNLGLSCEEKKEHDLDKLFAMKYHNMRSPRQIKLHPMSPGSLSTYLSKTGLLPLHLLLDRVPIPSRFADENMPQWCVNCPDPNLRWLGRYKLAEYLLSLSTDGVKNVLEEGKTVLHNATYIPTPTVAYKMISLLIQSGANVNAICQEKDEDSGDSFNFSPLHFALLNDEYLAWGYLDNNCALYTPSCSPPPAHLACYMNYSLELLLKLVRAMPDPNISGFGIYHGMNFDGSILYLACDLNKPDIVSSLLEIKDINIDLPSKTTDLTPLMLACRNGYDEIVEILVQNHANVCAINSENYNVLYYSVEGQSLPCIQQIIEAGGKQDLYLTYELLGGNVLEYAENQYLDMLNSDNQNDDDLDNLKDIILYLNSQLDADKPITHRDYIFETWIADNNKIDDEIDNDETEYE